MRMQITRNSYNIYQLLTTFLKNEIENIVPQQPGQSMSF